MGTERWGFVLKGNAQANLAGKNGLLEGLSADGSEGAPSGVKARHCFVAFAA